VSEARYREFEDHLAQSAGLLQEPEASDRAINLAALKMHRQRLVERLVAGHTVDSAELLRVAEAINGMIPPAPVEVPKVEIEFCRPLFEPCRGCGKCQAFICRACGHEEMVKDDAGEPPPEPPSPPSPPAPPPNEALASDSAKPTTVPSGGNVVPIRPAEKTGPSFTGVYEPWRAHVGAVGGGDSPFHAGPFPPGGGR
jgi:hypothetical protein